MKLSDKQTQKDLLSIIMQVSDLNVKKAKEILENITDYLEEINKPENRLQKAIQKLDKPGYKTTHDALELLKAIGCNLVEEGD